MGVIFNAPVLNQRGAPALFEDTIDNRPAASFEGRLFFATDVMSGDTIFRDTGSDWTALAGNGGGGLGASNGVTIIDGLDYGLGGTLNLDTTILTDNYTFNISNNSGEALSINTSINNYKFGNPNSGGNDSYIYFSDDSEVFNINFRNEFYIGTAGYGVGMSATINNGQTRVGDWNSQNNGCMWIVDDDNETLIVTSGLVTTSSGSTSGLHIKVRIAGLDYVIELKNA